MGARDWHERTLLGNEGRAIVFWQVAGPVRLNARCRMPPSDFSRLSRRRLAAGVCAALALAAFAGSLPSLAASTRWVSFAKGKVEVQLPTSIAVHEDPDGTLTGTFGPGGVNRLELTLLDPQKDARNDTAEQFVEFYARQRNLPVHTNGEK